MSRATLLSATLVIAAVAAGIAACTGPAGTQVDRGPGQSQAAARSSIWTDFAEKSYKLASTPRKGKIATLVKDDTRKFSVTDFAGEAGKKTKATMKDRKGKASQVDVLESTATCKAVVGSGAAHTVTFLEHRVPAMSDLDNTAVVTDTTSGNSRTFQSDQEFQRFTVSDGGQELTINTNPDGTYEVNGSPAATPADAAKLIVATPLGKGTSVHSLAAIYGTVLQRRKNAQTLGSSDCTYEEQNVGPKDDPGELILAVIDALSK